MTHTYSYLNSFFRIKYNTLLKITVMYQCLCFLLIIIKNEHTTNKYNRLNMSGSWYLCAYERFSNNHSLINIFFLIELINNIDFTFVSYSYLLLSGELKTAVLLDREAVPEYNLIAHVQDRETPGWDCTCQLNVQVTDVNDNPPTFPSKNYTAAVPEDYPVGSFVTIIHAVDKDSGRSYSSYTVVYAYYVLSRSP